MRCVRLCNFEKPCYKLCKVTHGADMTERKSLSLEIKANEAGEVTGYGSVFENLDSYGDRIRAGAFAGSLTKRKPKMLWQHRMEEPIGVWDEVREDDKGLTVKGRLALKTTRGAEAHELAMMGALDGLSIGYRTLDYEMEGNNRILKEIDLYEVSFVTIPANAMATLTSVKEEMTERRFEAMLGEMGFSRWDRKIIIANGFKAWCDQRDAGALSLDADQRDAEAIKSNLKLLLEGFRK